MFFNWHVTLRLAVFEIFAVKWSKFRPKISDLRIPGRYRPQKGRRSVRDRYVHRAKFHADRCHRRRNTCNRREKKTTTNRPFHTNVWRVIKVYKTVKLLSWNFQNKRATVLGFLAKLVKKIQIIGQKSRKGPVTLSSKCRWSARSSFAVVDSTYYHILLVQLCCMCLCKIWRVSSYLLPY